MSPGRCRSMSSAAARCSARRSVSLNRSSAPSRTLSCTKENRSRRSVGQIRPARRASSTIASERAGCDRSQFRGLGHGGMAAEDGACGEEARGSPRRGGRADEGRPWPASPDDVSSARVWGSTCHPRWPGRSAPDSTIARTIEVRTNGRPPETRLMTACASSGIWPIIDVTRSRVAVASNGRSSTVLAFGQPDTG